LDIATLSPLQKEQMEKAFKRSMGNEVERSSKEEEALLYGNYEPLTVQITHTLNQMAGIGWTSYSHTGVPVPVFAQGVNQDIFGGYYDNTDLFGKMAAAMGLNAAM
jgi:alkaline phosphatase